MERVLVWLRDALVTAGLLGRQAAVSLRYNWGIGVLALVLAVSLWVYVTDRENPEVTGRVVGAVRIETVNVPPNQAVFSISQESVTVRARASESVFEDLAAEDFRATVDLSGVTAQQATVPVRVESEEPRAEVVEVSPAEVTVRLEAVTTRAVPVRAQLVGTLPRGFEARSVTVQPEEAQVTGPESLVNDLVQAVEADVNLTGVRSSFQQTVLLQARDEQGGNIEGVDIAPESATVRVEVIQVIFSAVFIIRPEVLGVPAEGYNVISVQADPAIITVTGPADVLQGIDPVQGIATEEVSIDGATADVVRPVAVRAPEGASLSRSDVTVRVAIAPTAGQFGFSVAPRTANLGPGLSATLAPPTVQVVLAGAVPDLSAIRAQDVVATLDLGGLGPGDHVVPVQVQAPQGASVVSVTPPEVRVTIRAP